MSDPFFPEHLVHFLRTAIPTLASVELLLFLARHPDRRLTPAQVATAMQPPLLDIPSTRDYLFHFKSKGLLVGDVEAGFVYAPASDELRSAIHALALAYDQRPVSLIRIISENAESRLNSLG